jgi:hypothetical protein
MKKRVFTLLLAAGLLAVVALTALTYPALAQTQTVYVRRHPAARARRLGAARAGDHRADDAHRSERAEASAPNRARARSLPGRR